MATAQEGPVGLLGQAQRVLGAVAERADGLAGLSVAELSQVLDGAARIVRLADVVMLRMVGAVREQDRLAAPGDSLAARHGVRDVATLVMTVTGASRRTLKRWQQVNAATAPRGVGSTGVLPPLLPHLAQAVDAASVSVDQALVIRQCLHEAGRRAHPEDLEAAERALVAAATGASTDGDQGCDQADGAGRGHCQVPLTPELLAVQARLWRDAIDPDGPEPAYQELRRQRSFTLGQHTDGMWVGKLLLPPDQGEALRLALDAHNAPRTQARYEGEAGAGGSTAGTCAGQTGVGQAGAERPPAGSGWDDEPPSRLHRRGRLDERSTAQRQADTLIGLVMTAIEQPGAPRIGGEAATLMVTITSAELDRHATSGGGAAHLSSGEPVPAHVAARIICDGYLQACVLDESGLPLKLGRASRSHSRHQRRAILAAYPGGCQNPGCQAPPGYTEIHHPIWWSRGGDTDTENGIPLCQHCHTLLHTGHLTCTRNRQGRWRVEATLPLRSRHAA